MDTIAFLYAFVSISILFLCAWTLNHRRRKHFEDDQRETNGLHQKEEVGWNAEDGIGQRATILYCTQTGTAERFAKALHGEMGSKYEGSVRLELVDIEDYDFKSRLLGENMLIVITSTYGDGEPTDSAGALHEWLEEKTKGAMGNEAESLHYAIFGLGNRTYEHFCASGKFVDRALNTLGARRIGSRGEGDDDKDIEGDFDDWKEQLWAALETDPSFTGVQSPRQKQGTSIVEQHLAAFEVEFYERGAVEESPFFNGLPNQNGDYDTSFPFMSQVKACVELHTELSERSCVHVELEIGGASVQYETGDHVGIYPQNAEDVVERTAACLGLFLDQLVVLKKSSGNTDLPDIPEVPLSIRTLLASYTDLLSSPSRSALLALASFAKDPEEASQLRILGDLHNRQEFQQRILEKHTSLLEVLEEFPSARPTLGAFLGSIAPRLQPRFYSISSSNLHSPERIHITCAVVKDVTPGGRVHHGVCSSWLQRARTPSLLGSTTVPLFIRHSGFRLPEDPTRPIVMIGPGTGIAPFRGFLQHREALAEKGVKLGAAHLFFGCRDRDKDYIYCEELKRWEASGTVLTSLDVAFSRECKQKDYVQHHLKQRGPEIWPLIESGYIYVCGDAKRMAKDVHSALIEITRDNGYHSLTKAEEFLSQLNKHGRYLRDVW